MNDGGSCVRLTVTGTDTEGDVISLVTKGTLHEGEGWWALHYEETNPDSMTTAQAIVQVEGSRVTVTRTSTMLSTIVFDEGETFVGDYPTPMGHLRIRILASSVKVRRRGGMGRIQLVYEVTLSSTLAVSEEMDRRTLDVQFVPCRN